MENILIEKKEEIENGWIFEVVVGSGAGSTRHSVTVPREYWQSITVEKMEPEELVRRSFAFLLERESKEQILKKFELSLIQKYFPEYESEISIQSKN